MLGIFIALLGVIFHAPLFGFVNQVEDEDGSRSIPKNSKILLYFIAIIASSISLPKPFRSLMEVKA